MKKKLSFSFSDGHLHSRIRLTGKMSSNSGAVKVKDVPPRLWPQRRTSTTTIDTDVETASVIKADEANFDTDTEADTGKCPFKHGTVYGESSFPALLVLNVFITMINHSFVFVHKYQHVRTLDTFTATRRRESAQIIADLK